MDIFSMNQETLKSLSTIFTATEIHQQPQTWKKTISMIKEMKNEIKQFIEPVLTSADFDVILCGAGTSEFVGNALYSYLGQKLSYKVKSYATTDLVATPENFLSRTKPTLLISFGRSGNSPESVGAVDVANTVCQNLYHLFITCNHEGALSLTAKDNKNCLAINLTPETHDQSFAMTSSFSNMYLACLLALQLYEIDQIEAELQEIIENSSNLVTSRYSYFSDLVNDFNFDRIVYLGANTLKGTAQESALKMLELSAGRVVTMYDTPLGFRHGPKSIINNSTLCVMYLSDDEYSRQYEIDLLKEMAGQRKDNKILVVDSSNDESVRSLADYYYTFDNKTKHNNVLLGLEYIICAQLIALFKSLALNITPDNPCPTGEVNRVVKGVTLYPYTR